MSAVSSNPEIGTTSLHSHSSSGKAPPSVLLRRATLEELLDPNSPYTKKEITIFGDGVGYGFVVRGCGPSYIQTIDPHSPAAAAGLKVRQYVASVNGQDVLAKSHTEISHLIAKQPTSVRLGILQHFRDQSHSSR